jgi:hypothetical protein
MKYLAAVLIAATLCVGCSKTEPPAAPAKPVYEKLLGKWLRTDGDYMIEVTGASDDGQLKAGYFNPNPIHVEKAVAGRTNSAMTVYIVLRDVNYPGCTYKLTHDPSSDRLRGEYYQAAQQQTYTVEFEHGQ